MKNLIFLLICCVFTANLSATVRTVSNSSNTPGQYQTIQAAVDAAVAGDVILVEGSGTLYDAPIVSKQLDFKAAGFNPGTFNHRKAMLTGTFKLLAGAEGSVVSGFGSNGTGWSIEVNCANVRIEKNDLGYVYFTYGSWGPFNLVNGEVILAEGSNGAIIQDNILCHIIQTTTTNLDILVQHNMFFLGAFQVTNDHFILSGLTGSYIFRNNYFEFQHGLLLTNVYGGFFRSISGALFENNIFRTTTMSIFGSLSSCIFNNNMTDQASLPMSSGANNLISTSPNFVNPNQTFFLSDYRLKSSSAGKNAGTDGQDIGAHTALHPFFMTGEPNEMPVIRSITLSNENVAPNSSFQVKIVATKAKSN
jgi:hypothetical protein